MYNMLVFINHEEHVLEVQMKINFVCYYVIEKIILC